MTRTLVGHFDGKVIVPDEPVQLPVGRQLHIEVAVMKPKKPQARRKIIGLGRHASGIPDLGSNKRHLRGFGQ